MADTPLEFEAKVQKLVANMVTPAGMRRVGDAGARDGTGVVRSRIGDTSLSHFTRKSPIDVSLRNNVQVDGFIIRPDGKAKGPSRVLNDGRKGYAKGDRRATGKLSRKTGAVLTRKVKRGGGATRGKHTWDDGRQLIVDRTPGRVHEEFLKELAKVFRG